MALIQQLHVIIYNQHIKSMLAQSKVPTTKDLIAQVSASVEVQYEYVDRMLIGSLDQQSINELQTRVSSLKPSDFKTDLEKRIQCRKNQLKPFEEQKMQFERNKDRLDSQKLQFQRQKQEFHEKIQACKLAFSVILTMVGLLLTACGIYTYILQAPQFAVPAGGSIQKGTVDTKFQGIGGALISALAFGVGLVTTGFCCWRCCKIKI